jgi:hypothetical protein
MVIVTVKRQIVREDGVISHLEMSLEIQKDESTSFILKYRFRFKAKRTVTVFVCFIYTVFTLIRV